MISALTHGKCNIEKKEDIKTSSFFDTLLLLPDDVIWNIIRESCYDNTGLPVSAGTVLREETALWPSWDAKDTGNASRVEPDVFIRFEHIDLIVEAKQENNQQREGQWRSEYTSYCNEFGDTSKNAVVIAIDGNANKENEKISAGRNKTFLVVKTEWQQLYETVIAEHRKQNKENSLSHIIPILRQLRAYGDFLGMTKTVWPEKAFENALEFDGFEKTIHTLCAINSAFDPKDGEKKTERIGFNNMPDNEYIIAGFSANIKTLTKMECNYE